MTLAELIDDRDAASIAKALHNREFTMIEVEGDEEGEEKGAMVAQMEDFDVVVAFSSEEQASEFAQEMPDLFEDETVDGFLIDGYSLFTELPEDIGLIIDPESEHCCVLDPDLVKAIIDEMDQYKP
jgi:hypothetical protein